MKEIKIKVPDVAHIVISGPTQCGKSIVMDTIEKALGQRFPVTLYAPSWLKVLDQADEIRQFIEDNKDNLEWK